MAIKPRGRWYWEDYLPVEGKPQQRPPGEDLAALRQGLTGKPGTVPAMWPFYRALIDSDTADALAQRGLVSSETTAEHAALALFGLHQQSKDKLMHQPGVRFGAAVRRLHTSGAVSADSVDAALTAAATATSLPALLSRLRGLVTLLRDISQPLDYTQLVRELHGWSWPDSRSQTRLRWGLAYHATLTAQETNA